MKTYAFLVLFCFFITGASTSAQKSTAYEKHGKTLNIGLGVGGYSGYYRHVDRTLSVFSINYEFDAARNFTLAPSVTVFTYRDIDKHYRESVIPIGLKGTYYLDQLVKAGRSWDFYLAGTTGFVFLRSNWYDGYYGETLYQNISPLFLDLHIGSEYHFNKHVGMFIDLSTGVSTLGISIR